MKICDCGTALLQEKYSHIARENVLTLGSYLLAHGNWYMRIGRNFNVGRLTALEAVQDVVEALFGLRNDYIKFPITEAESELPNIVGAIDESQWLPFRQCCGLFQSLSAT